MKRVFSISVVITCLAAVFGCGGAQEQEVALDVRPLPENKAFEIIEEMLAERSYFIDRDVSVTLATKSTFSCDYRIKNHKIAIEYLTEEDRIAIGDIPPPAGGSRLHVLNARVTKAPPAPGATAGSSGPSEPVYVFFIDDRKFTYHFNPTSEHRADVTFLEVDSRLRRDLADFLSWYETSIVKR
ncbi:MAG: hypothetical protein GY854_00780 [Deltaproteobacteria bacterium]|nr:hypothetical protein [Deltaproteobacteria bacterium]